MTSTESGYTWCGCRDCFEITIGRTDVLSLCPDCDEAGCSINDGECQRDDACAVCTHTDVRPVDEFTDECIDCGKRGSYDQNRGAFFP